MKHSQTSNLPTIQSRLFIRDFLGMTMYFISWFFLLCLPIVSIILIINNLHKGLLIFFQIIFPSILIVLLCFILRWLAKGVVQGRKSCFAIAGLCAIVAGCYQIFSFATTVDSSVAIVLFGLFNIIGAILLFFLTISPGSADSHET